VEVEWNGVWYPAVILRADPRHRGDDGRQAPWLIRYEGYSESSDEWVGPERIRHPATARAPDWTEGPFPAPPAGEDWHAFTVAKAGKPLYYVDPAGIVWREGRKVANFDYTWGWLYRNGTELGRIDTRGDIRVKGKTVARWDWGGGGLFYGAEEEARLGISYGLISLRGVPWGSVAGPGDTALGEDGAFALLMVCLVPEFAP
jgi:hypothetical protein